MKAFRARVSALRKMRNTLWVSISNKFKRRLTGGQKVKMLNAIPIAKQTLRVSPIKSEPVRRHSPTEDESTPYAVSADFCRIFENDMDCLYLLSFLLTAEHALAEECFVRGLEDSAKSNRVFREWARSWARRKVIQSAIQLIRPMNSSTSSSRSDRMAIQIAPGRAEIAAVIELPAFERFVLVMSVLESYSDQECALLLDSTRSDVMAARTRALQQIAWSAKLQHKPASIGLDEQARQGEVGSTSQREAFSHLAA